MSTSSAIFLALTSFLASAVEMVEALTIVLAVGVTRGWRSALIGVGTAVLALVAVVGSFGPLLTRFPIDDLRLVVGTLLLIFGLQWLRKAILRASGYKALHDEDEVFRREREEARRAGTVSREALDWYSFTLCFKGVFLEGLEVAFIVLTFGSAQGSVSLAASGAGVALLLVAIAGLVLHAPLSTVPENSLKFAVGVMLTTFGIFWSAEGVGLSWPGKDLALLALLAYVGALSYAFIAVLKRRHQRDAAPVVVSGGV